MKKKLDKRFIWISVIFTTIFQSINCFYVLFIDNSNSIDFKLTLLAVFSLLLSIIMLSVKDEKTKSIGLGILFGTILTAIVFSIIVLFALMSAWGNYNNMSK